MASLRALLYTILVSLVLPTHAFLAKAQQSASDVPTFRATSNLVFLDVTVLDKKGRPVMKGLTKDDFTIAEEGKAEPIFSFEAPETHLLLADGSEDSRDGRAPVTIFVLDLLNSRFEDFAFIRYSVRKYLDAQPSRLQVPAELMVLGDESLEMLQGYTRSREDLLYALDHLPPRLPYKVNTASFFAERFVQSIEALQQIALQNKGIPGRKNIVWVGRGGPGVNTGNMTGKVVERLTHYVHAVINLLVEVRMSLYLIYPGLKVDNVSVRQRLDSPVTTSNDDPWSGEINFNVFVAETGGSLFYNRNDFDGQMKRSQELGSKYYTLTYQPHQVTADGKFRRVRVSLRDRNLHAITKEGYYAPEVNAALDPRRQSMVNLAEAVHSTIPFNALDIRVSDVVRHPHSRSAEVSVEVKGKGLVWSGAENGKSITSLLVATASLSGRKEILSSKYETLTFSAGTQDRDRLANKLTRLTVSLQVPRKTQSVRLVVQNEEGGQIGAVDVSRQRLDMAPVAPTQSPQPASQTIKNEPQVPARR